MADRESTVQLELHVPDFGVAKEFYRKLGFTVAAEPDPEYLVMQRAGAVIRFWPGNDRDQKHEYFQRHSGSPKGVGVEIIITVENLSRFFEDVKDKVSVVSPLKKRSWGLKDFRIEDPFGYYLRITEPHDILDKDSNAV